MWQSRIRKTFHFQRFEYILKNIGFMKIQYLYFFVRFFMLNRSLLMKLFHRMTQERVMSENAIESRKYKMIFFQYFGYILKNIDYIKIQLL